MLIEESKETSQGIKGRMLTNMVSGDTNWLKELPEIARVYYLILILKFSFYFFFIFKHKTGGVSDLTSWRGLPIVEVIKYIYIHIYSCRTFLRITI